MRRTLVVALLAGFAALGLATPASAVPSSSAAQLGEAKAPGVIQTVRDRDWRRYGGRNYDRRWSYNRGYGYRYRPYGYYGYRPYYRPYAYYGRPYGYYGYGWPYYRRPGLSFGFAF
jgi:hypothetical protein